MGSSEDLTHMFSGSYWLLAGNFARTVGQNTYTWPSTGHLGFLTIWQLGSKGERIERAQEQVRVPEHESESTQGRSYMIL